MNNSSSATIWAIVLFILVIVIGVYIWKTNKGPIVVPPIPAPVIVVAPPSISTMYSCDAGKTISATFNTTANTVTIVLSDGRTLILPQTISADGVRYANADSSIIFWTKGGSAYVQEGQAMTYTNCVSGTNTPTQNETTTFTDSGKTFSFSYPSTVTVSGGDGSYTTDWLTNNIDQTLGLVLAKAILPNTFEQNTNFSEATLTVGTSADPTAVADCLVAKNGDQNAGTVTINGVPYSKFTLNDAAAGNRYDTTSYLTVRNNQCYVIEYTIHYGAIENYPPSSGITAFNETSVQSVMESMAQSFKFL